MAYGVTLQGFKKKRLIDIKAEIEATLKTSLSENVNLIPQSVLGQIVGIVAERESIEWEMMEQVYLSFYPQSASGVNLDNLVAINGIQRLKAKQSQGYVQLVGVDGTVVTAGSIINTSDTNESFTVDYDITIAGVTNAAVTSVKYGEILGLTGTLTNIQTPINGWNSVSNSNDVLLGQVLESDSQLRLRRDRIVGRNAQNIKDSLIAQLLLLTGVVNVAVIDNKTDITDSNNIPPHKFLTVVEGGTDSEIGKVVWDNTPQGINSFGSVTVPVLDASNNLQNVFFSRPALVPIYFIITITTDSSYLVGSDVQIKQDIVSYGNSNFKLGDDVITSKFYTPINKTNGIISIDIKIGKTSSPTSSVNIPISSLEVSQYIDANVSVIVQ